MSSSPTASMAPSALSTPLMTIDSEHHGAIIVIAAAIGLSVTLISLLIRLYVRLSLSSQFGHDDIVLLAATAFACSQSATVFWAVSKGFGTSIDLVSGDQLLQVQKAVTASDICYLITLYLTKCCIVAIFLRLTPNKYHNRGSWATLALSTLWVIPAVFMISVNCGLKQPWADIVQQCTNLFLRWQLIAAFDVITEACLFFLAVFLLKGLQMSFKEKMIVLSAFGFRLPVIAFAVVRLHFLNNWLASSNITLDMVNTAIWTQVELHYSVVACTTFCLKPFVVAVSTNYGTAGTELQKSAYGSDTQHSTSNYALRSRTRSTPDVKISHPVLLGGAKLNSGMFRGDKVNNTATAMFDRKGDANSIESNGSTKLIIKKHVGYTVQYTGAEETAGQPSAQ